jgi:methylated-DNA-[protein]-cysteine S-methyltransferase
MEWAVLETPIGPVSVGVADGAVQQVRLASRVNGGGAATGVLAEAVDQLRAYFQGSRTEFDLPVSITPSPAPPRPSGALRPQTRRPASGELEQAVWAELLRIPYGEMRTYGEVAAAVGDREAARAVGTACNRNPIPLIVPCHRVVGAGGKLVGFGAGLPRKRWLLEHEARVSLERAWA